MYLNRLDAHLLEATKEAERERDREALKNEREALKNEREALKKERQALRKEMQARQHAEKLAEQERAEKERYREKLKKAGLLDEKNAD